MNIPPHNPQRQRGVALIIALVLMALATILAAKIGFEGYLERRRAMTMLAAEQAYQFGMGAEALAADALTRGHQQGAPDTLADEWAQPMPPIPLRPPNDPEGAPMGTLQGYLDDQQGRFNINNLLKTGPDGKPDPQPLEQFQNILVALNIEPRWAQLARDWIDADSLVDFPDGAEDAVYTAQNPPYLTANQPMLSTSELLSLPGFGAERYQKLAPYITALPVDTTINVCTAPGLVLDSFVSNRREFTGNPDALIAGRKNGCFPTVDTFDSVYDPAKSGKFKLLVSEKSTYFRLTTRVALGTTDFTLYSLLLRGGTGRVTPLLRSFGTT